jgi:NAD(P)-dependent dehydrogenase (short-subunit alcohol dehydrogenase family)
MEETSRTPLEQQVIIVTGANTGIGRETVLQLADLNVKHIILACRSQPRAEEAIVDIKKRVKVSSATTLEFQALDLCDLSSVRKFADEFHAKNLPLHVLINNAGVWSDLSVQAPVEIKGEKIDPMYVANQLGHHLLTHLLLDDLKKTKGRVVVVTSDAHKFTDLAPTVSLHDYVLASHYENNLGKVTDFARYGSSKLFNLWFMEHLHRLYHGSTGITFNAVHPGAVKTEIGRDVSPWLQWVLVPVYLFFRTPAQGAQTSVFLSVDPSVEGKSGGYYIDSKPAITTDLAKDRKRQLELYELEQSLTKQD